MKKSNIGYLKRRVLFSTLFFLSLITGLAAQEKTVKYNILQNDNIIGQMKFCQKKDSGNLYLSMVSSAKSRFVFSIEVNTEERAHFRNGLLVSSSVQRRVNGKEKANRQTHLINTSYQLKSERKTSRLNRPINYNLLLLYANEPSNLSQVYSDNYQQFLEIKQTSPHSYRIQLPDGNYNDYYFSDGICKEIILHHSFYTITMRLA
ncbi:DUF6134 family protein [Pedobacter antarcticus]|uniref:DUF6134 family protein n=1 Tax=Pedobacter antarcticus TaxID=34086 RepID=UPI001C58192B|nr:DUF6134 family protein [Pedobacter antarcticus]